MKRTLHSSIIAMLRTKLGDAFDEYVVPPPVFEDMQGEFIEYREDEALLITRFPVFERYCNPYGSMQGGMLAAAVDNTLGPLSMLVAPPSVTRRLEMKYSRPATPDMAYITVRAQFMREMGGMLHFKAEVRDQVGNLLARARSTHWVVDEMINET